MLKYFKEKTSKTQVYIKLKIVFASSFKVYSELGGFFNFQYNISFIDPPLGEFVEILPSVMIFISSLRVINITSDKYHHFG